MANIAAARAPRWRSILLAEMSGRDALQGLVVFALAIAPLLFLKFHNGRVPGDLAIYRRGGSIALHLGNPYAHNFTQGLRVKLPFTYPPFAALVVVPLTLLPPHLSLWVWTAFNLGLVVGLAWWLFRPTLARLEWRQPAVLGLVAAVLVWTFPVAQTIAYGQINLTLAVACLLDCTRTGGRRGILVGLATAIKLTPGLFIVYFAVTRQWAAAGRAAVTTLATMILAAALMPTASREYWLHLVFDRSRPGSPTVYYNQSLYGALLRGGGPAWLWPFLAAGAAAFGLWRAARAHRAGAEVAAVALVGLTAVLVSPISWQHHAVWVVLVLAVLAEWTVQQVGHNQSPRRMAVLAGVAVLVLVPVPQVGDLLVRYWGAPVLPRIVQSSDVILFLVLLVALPLRAVTDAERQPQKVPG